MKEQLLPHINTNENTQVSKDNIKENREINNSIKIDLYGEECEIETISYDFEYPEKIQKETGILGYKRTIITNEEILKISKNILNDYGIDVSDCTDLNSIRELLRDKVQKKRIEFGFDEGNPWQQSKEFHKKWKDYENTREGRIMNEFSESHLYYELDSFLSNGEFPKQTFNHQMGAHQDGEFEKYFIQDKFFIQKLFDINLAEKMKLGKRATSSDSEEAIPMIAYYKNKNKIEHTHTEKIGDYKDEINENKVFLIGPDAFNTSAGTFWTGNSKMTSFGFTLNDNLFKEYIKKVYEFLLTNNFDTESEIIGIQHIIRMIIFCDNDFQKNLESFMLQNENTRWAPENDKKKLSHEFYKTIENFLPSINLKELVLNKKPLILRGEDYNESFVNEIENFMDNNTPLYSPVTGATIKAFLMDNGQHKADEIHIPVLINHNEIFQISWGHAKYAHFFNNKGFNFIKFNHSEHLPEPENKM